MVWVPGGEWNIRHFVEQGRRDDIMKLTIRTLEYVLEQVKNHGNKPLVAIYGFEGLTYHKVSHFESKLAEHIQINFSLKVYVYSAIQLLNIYFVASRIVYAGFQLLEQNYPEILQNVIIVNGTLYILFNVTLP